MSSNGQQQFWLHSDQKDGSNSDWTNIIPTLNDGHAMTSVSGALLKKIVMYRLEDPQISSWRSSIFTIDNDLHSNHNRQAGLTYKGHFTFFGLAPGSDYEVNLTTKYKYIKLIQTNSYILHKILSFSKKSVQMVDQILSFPKKSVLKWSMCFRW